MRHVDSRAFSFVVLIVAFSLIYAGILNAVVSSIDDVFATTTGELEEGQGSESTVLPPPKAVIDANNNNIPIPGTIDQSYVHQTLKDL